ncbi:c-type cytochrome [Bradyrhizobium betae]|uniref:c-type cytochrome n=1 Tax=Bradyrhizobium betae TaxID=244734 RepID=UPI001FCEACEE|nr:hypothetical protein [Bradyrhizobium betae]
MSGHVPDAKIWFAGIVFFGLVGVVGYSLPHLQAAAPVEAAAETIAKPAPQAFRPPLDAEPTDDKFGEMVRLGERIFNDTAANAGEFVGNDLRCANCHLDGGRLPNSAPLWAAFVNFPTYRPKNDHVNTFAERLQGCFNYSMNGKAPRSATRCWWPWKATRPTLRRARASATTFLAADT